MHVLWKLCCVFLGKVETKENGCGQSIVLEREEDGKAKSIRLGRKVKHFLNWNNLPHEASTMENGLKLQLK